MASAETMTYQDTLDSQYLSSSLSSLSSSRSTNSLIVRTYKQATQFYLTKRFREALDALEPIVSPQAAQQERPTAVAEDGDGFGGAGFGDGINSTSGSGSGSAASTAATTAAAPVAQSSRGTRTKIWVFYLTLLHSIIELGAEAGRTTMGSTRWKSLAEKVRSGAIWTDVVSHGYGGNEGEVDADVVVNLATLLLGHMPSQHATQKRMETYLAASDNDAAIGYAWAQQQQGGGGVATPMSNASASPKLLASRLKILELYTLHVLPANGEWEFARTFIEMNDLLDEERKEAFLAALENVKEERDATARRERELREQRERDADEQLRRETQEAVEAAARRKREDEEEREKEARRLAATAAAEPQARRSSATATAAAAAAAAAVSSADPELSPANSPLANGKASASSAARSSSSSSSPATTKKKAAQHHHHHPTSTPPPATFYRRASAVLGQLQRALLSAGRHVNAQNLASTAVLLRLLMFLAAFLLLVARRDLRVKLRRALDDGWRRVKQTVGMGVKVSYL